MWQRTFAYGWRFPRTSRTIRSDFVFLLVLMLVTALLPPVTTHAATLPAGFQESIAFRQLAFPTALRFSPDGRVFIAEKSGIILVFDNLSDVNADEFADLRTNVYNFWDRGLLGMALDPNFPNKPYVYVLYTYDHQLGDPAPAPRWGPGDGNADPCPNPPGATSDGCVVSARLSRLQWAPGNVMIGSEQVLIEDWCQQYPSHSIGSLAFGPDGALYVSAGDGASFTYADYGQGGGSAGSPTPKNPCGDPPTGVGGTQTAPTAEGGALRSQDLRTSGDPVTLDGAILRINPDTGAAMPDNPLASNADPNARRIIAHGLRNPFRITNRPGTNEIWIGDVGWNDWEEIDRISNPTASVVNFGWPCYEGPNRQNGYDSANLNICETLYSQPNADTKPYFAYHHSNAVVPGEGCPTGSSSISGLSFAFYTGGSYPDEYKGALFFADFSRNCIWAMVKDANGLPAPGLIRTFVAGAASPVDLQIGPGGDLFYVDYNGGTIRRIQYTGSPPSSCPTGQFNAEYYNNSTLSGSPTFTRCETSINYDWGQGGPGNGVGSDNFSVRWTGLHSFNAGDYTFSARTDDGIRVWLDGSLIIDAWFDQAATLYQATRTLTAGNHEVKVEYYEDCCGAVAQVNWQPTNVPPNSPPTATITAPSANTTWKVGDTISFTGSATDPEEGALPASKLNWSVILHHCPSNCHTHIVQTFSGVASGSFSAPDHEYPSYLEIQLTATDSGGLQDTKSVLLDPQTVALTFQSTPSGLQLTVNNSGQTAPFNRTVIVGSNNSISAPSPQTLNGTTYLFATWSDSGAQTHNITAGATPTTYSATYSSQANTTMHIGDLDGVKSTTGNGWKAAVTITVHNANESPVANASVSGAWRGSGGYTANGTCTTDSSGRCSISTGRITNTNSTVTFTVNSVTHATLTYASASNHDPDGDSNGTSITVSKP